MPPRGAMALAALAAVAAIGAVVAVVTMSAPTTVVAGLLGVALVLTGASLASWSHALRAGGAAVETRAQHGPGHSRREMFLRFGMGAAALSTVGIGVYAARRIDRSVAALKTTRWEDGTEIVDSDGQPVAIDRIGDGEVLTVYPRGAVGSIDSQAVLVREPIDRFTDDTAAAGAMVDGLVIYSKLCTHMGCSLGLYQQGTGTLLCPCHQAVFDVLDVGRAVTGPARRALPWLPFRQTEDGRLIATGDFSDAVGAGFWWRP